MWRASRGLKKDKYEPKLFRRTPHGGLWFDMVESKELREFYLLLFSQPQVLQPVESSIVSE